MKQLPVILFGLAALTAMLGAAPPTFDQDIAPILYANCATCHRPGEVAPFSLLTYQDASKRAALIAGAVKGRFMPPWKAEPGFGDFAGERRLTDAQIALISEWAKAGAPEGDPAVKPQPPKFTDGWQGGEPDQVLTLPSKYALPADGPDQYRCFVLPTGLDHDVYIDGIEFRPGNRRIVHHALVFLDASGKAKEMAAASPDGSYPCFGGPGFQSAGLIGGWAPGLTPAPRNPAYSAPIRQGMDVVMQIHYHPSGKPEQDQSSLGLAFSGPPTKGRTSILLFDHHLDIAPGDSNYVAKASLTLPRDVQLAGLTPHAHYLCKDMKVTAALPDGTTQPLIWIKDWDFNWQNAYRYRTPLDLPKGTRIDLVYTYDNSENNPHNPAHPPVHIRWGEETKDEMALVFLNVLLPSRDDIRDLQRSVGRQYVEQFLSQVRTLQDLPYEMLSSETAGRLTQLFKTFDKNGDGRLDDDERAAMLAFVRNVQEQREEKRAQP
ncbi:MAG: ascorbate-dependent monooxygenase [Bryobacteraceae bacterium]